MAKQITTFKTDDILAVIAEQDFGKGMVPVDTVNIERDGDKYKVRGDWVGFDEAIKFAKQQLGIS